MLCNIIRKISLCTKHESKKLFIYIHLPNKIRLFNMIGNLFETYKETVSDIFIETDELSFSNKKTENSLCIALEYLKCKKQSQKHITHRSFSIVWNYITRIRFAIVSKAEYIIISDVMNFHCKKKFMQEVNRALAIREHYTTYYNGRYQNDNMNFLRSHLGWPISIFFPF